MAAIWVFLVASCSTLIFSVEKSTLPFPAYPEARFAVLTDLHVFLSDLGIGQPAFERIKYSDRKIFEYSASLLNTAIGEIIQSHPQFVLVPGDLSKDGEEEVHQAVAAALGRLEAAGIQVFVVPGNHDVNNPGAVKYEGDRTSRVAAVTPEDFAEIYRDFGYGSAVDRDPYSLAYVAEPVPGLWLMAIDACRYDLSLNESREHTGGSLSSERLEWIRKMLDRARKENKAVIAMMHHGVVQHFEGQKGQVVFTGHFHAQNIAGAWWDQRDTKTALPSPYFIYDVETGSPSAIRVPIAWFTLVLTQVMSIRSRRIDSIPEMPEGFTDYAREYSRRGIFPYVQRVLMGYGLSRQEAARIAGPLADAGIAHYAGDPCFQGTEMYPTRDLSLMGSIAIALKKDVIVGMWKGEPPHADNAIDIDLADGTWRRVD